MSVFPEQKFVRHSNGITLCLFFAIRPGLLAIWPSKRDLHWNSKQSAKNCASRKASSQYMQSKMDVDWLVSIVAMPLRQSGAWIWKIISLKDFQLISFLVNKLLWFGLPTRNWNFSKIYVICFWWQQKISIQNQCIELDLLSDTGETAGGRGPVVGASQRKTSSH